VPEETVRFFMKNRCKWVARIVLVVLGFHLESMAYENVVWEGVTYDDRTVAELITVITTTSPLQSIPTTKHLYYAQKSLAQIPALALCKKIIAFDDIQPTSNFAYRKRDYDLYKKHIKELTETDPYFANTELIFLTEWGCLVGALKEAFKRVKTPFVFIQQHDLLLLKTFDLNALIATMVANPAVRYVTLLPGTNGAGYLPYWKHLDDNIKGVHFVPLCRAGGWTDQCHVARADYYRNFVFPRCPGNYMESHILHQYWDEIERNGFEKAHDLFGIYLYGSLEDGFFITHTNGKYH